VDAEDAPEGNKAAESDDKAQMITFHEEGRQEMCGVTRAGLRRVFAEEVGFEIWGLEVR
jgi:hypothetical protein